METKKWYKSKGVDGGIGAIAGTGAIIIITILNMFGIDAAGEQETIIQLIATGVGFVGGIFAVIGRLKAKARIE